MADPVERSAPALIGDLVGNVTELFRKEMQLLRAELREKSTQAVTAIGLIVAAIVIALTALNVLAAALVAAITAAGLDGGWAALIVGAVFAIVAFALAAKGISDLKASNLVPERTADAVTNDARMAKEKM